MQVYLYDGRRAVSQGLDWLLPNGGGGATTLLQIRQGAQVQLAISMSSCKDAKAGAGYQAPAGRGRNQHRQKGMAESHFVTILDGVACFEYDGWQRELLWMR